MSRQLISSGSTFEQEIGYSRAVVEGDWIFVSGTTGYDYATMTISENIDEQTEQCLKNLNTILQAAGSDLSCVLRCGVFLLDMREFDQMNAVYARVFGDHRPARTTIQAAGLPGEGLRVEIDCIAYVK